MTTVDCLLDSTVRRLESAGVERSRLEAELLLALALGMSRLDVLRGLSREPSETERQRFEKLLSERERRVPLAYLRGTQEFYGLEFEVSSAVLIPRPETELLVEAAIETLRGRADAAMVDVGTGSGCIAISAATALPMARIIATEVSEAALEIARRNAERHCVADRVELVRTNVLDGMADSSADLIVSNPPYIPSAEIESLQPEVRDYEPRGALDGGPDGLDFYRVLGPEARRVLRPGGRIAVEAGAGQADDVAPILMESGFEPPESRPDLARILRVVTAILPAALASGDRATV